MKKRISYKLIYYIVAISLIISSISVYIQINNSYKHKIKLYQNELNNIEKERLQILSESLWNVNQVSIDIFLKNLLNNDKFIYAKIIEIGGNTIEEGKNKKTNIISKEFTINQKINNKNYNIGKLFVVADLAPLYTELRDHAITVIITELIKIFFIVLIIIFVMKKILTNKIEIMAQYAKQLSLNTLDKALDIHINENKKTDYTELDTVADAINTMRTNFLIEIDKSKEKDNLLAHQSKMAAMGEMIGNIAHQWRQPLSAISTASSGIKLEHEMGMLKEDRLVKLLDSITLSTQYLSDTIDDFSNFFKPVKEKEKFYLQKTIEKTFSLINHQFTNNDIHIIKDISDIEILGYENELIQILINIFNNARQELIKKDKDKSRYIFVTAEIKDNQILIQIKDNAGGIPIDIISRIFEPYFTTKNKSQGTGIGLYMSQEIITKHFQGNLSVKNKTYIYNNDTHLGAEFTIKLNIEPNNQII